MVRFYDNWERLVVAVMRREQLRQLSLEESRSPSIRSYDSDFSFSCSSSSRYNDDDAFYKESVSSLHPDAVKLRLAQSAKELGKQSGGISRKTRKVIRKGISIFSVFSFKKDNGRGEREFEWAKSQRTFHGNSPSSSSKQSNEEVSVMAEEAKRAAEIARLREVYTLKGHIESVMKAKGLDINSIPHYYTV